MTGATAALALGDAAGDAGYRLEAHDEVVSTNDLALARAREGLTRLWVVARRQTGGRGRHGRVWSSPQGNLFASLVLIDPCETQRAPELGFVAGLALFDAASALTGVRHPRLSLKWPNDLMLDGAKCAGILLEGHRLPGGVFALIIGIGVNVGEAPPGAAKLQSPSTGASLERLLPLLSDSFARSFAAWVEAPASSEAHYAAWGARAHGMGQQVRVKMPKGDVVGLFHGLDRGRLVLDTAEGRKTLDAGDLYVLDAGVASHPAPA